MSIVICIIHFLHYYIYLINLYYYNNTVFQV
nr:MAG TPA: hypothetical protein [Caudoviricetes sp.]